MRKKPTSEAETTVLVSSRRRCALCYGLRRDLGQKDGQLAHVDRNPANSDVENLCYLCFDHHNQYDSRPSQAKGFTPNELRHYRNMLYSEIERFGIDLATHRQSSERVFLTLESNSYSSSGVLDLILKNDGDPFNIQNFEAASPGLSLGTWHPRSLSSGELLRAPTNVAKGPPGECIYHLKIRDRSGSTRSFQITVDPSKSPAEYDFLEITSTDSGST
jgi:hypothetical protein